MLSEASESSPLPSSVESAPSPQRTREAAAVERLPGVSSPPFASAAACRRGCPRSRRFPLGFREVRFATTNTRPYNRRQQGHSLSKTEQLLPDLGSTASDLCDR